MKIIKLDPKETEKIIKEIANSLKAGKVIVCPTDTVYGLIADATSKKAVRKVFKIKKRSIRKPIPVFIRNMAEAKKLAKINKEEEEFLKKVWPGKTTAVLKRKQGKIYGVLKRTIALRIPKYKLIDKLQRATKLPLTGTSANISGYPPSTKIEKVIQQFKGQKYQPDIILDRGDLKPSKPSQVIDLTGRKPRILRK